MPEALTNTGSRSVRCAAASSKLDLRELGDMLGQEEVVLGALLVHFVGDGHLVVDDAKQLVAEDAREKRISILRWRLQKHGSDGNMAFAPDVAGDGARRRDAVGLVGLRVGGALHALVALRVGGALHALLAGWLFALRNLLPFRVMLDRRDLVVVRVCAASVNDSHVPCCNGREAVQLSSRIPLEHTLSL